MKKSIEHINNLKNLLPLGNNFHGQKKTKCRSQASSPWSKKSSIVKNTTSLGSNEFSLGKGLSSPRRSAPSPWGT